MRQTIAACLLAMASWSGAAFAQSGAPAADRPAADIARDPLRHPAELLAFAHVAPGQKVADIMPGSGYFTRLFSTAVGPTGHVYAIVPSELAHAMPKTQTMAQAVAAEPGRGNVAALVVPLAEIAAPEKLDLAWTSDNYHDVYGAFGAPAAAAMDHAVFEALKPGGRFIVIDHVAAAENTTAPTTLHRIDPAVVRAQVLAAGFVFEGESKVLARSEDDHTKRVFDPSVKGKTDQFVFSFRKP